MFITFEGPEGAGKTTQIKKLCATLQSRGLDVVLTREPGGTPLAEKIRTLLITRDAGDWDSLSEVLLLYAARLEHIKNVIRPALAQGKIVISDRFSDSTKAYQGNGRGVDMNVIHDIEKISIQGFSPDLTLILDIDVEKGLKRTLERFQNVSDNSSSTEDRFEREGLEFHQKLRQGYLEIAKKEPERCFVIDADDSVENIENKIKSIVLEKLGKARNVVAG